MRRDIARIDMKTGEVIESEPVFVKAYVGHLAQVKGMTKMQTEVLWFLLSRMNYDNTVFISKKIRDKYIVEKGTSGNALSNCVTALAKAGFIDIEGSNQYFVNPDYFTRTDWTNTKKLVAKWTFSVNGVEFEKDIINEAGEVIVEADPIEEQVKKKAKPKKEEINIDLPDWIDRALWDDFVAMRKKIKAVNSERALKTIINDLSTWQSEGYDANTIIEVSVVNSWKGVFKPKYKQAKNNKKPIHSFDNVDYSYGVKDDGSF